MNGDAVKGRRMSPAEEEAWAEAILRMAEERKARGRLPGDALSVRLSDLRRVERDPVTLSLAERLGDDGRGWRPRMQTFKACDRSAPVRMSFGVRRMSRDRWVLGG